MVMPFSRRVCSVKGQQIYDNPIWGGIRPVRSTDPDELHQDF
jgi:hypothetical protein